MGAEDCQIPPKEYDGDIISNVGRYRREGGGGEKEICVGGYIGSSKVCGGCSVVRGGALGQWRRRGSTELGGRLRGATCCECVTKIEKAKFRN